MKIICVGRNYADHAKELHNPVPTEPVIFIKPDTAVLKPGEDFYLPDFDPEIHFECEVAYRICREGKNIQPSFSTTYIDSVGLGIDFTARTLQENAKQKGLPWTLAKAFNGSAPISTFSPIANYSNLQDIHFELKVNGISRQIGHTQDQIFSIEFLISFISKYFLLKTGDLIFTGTPAGVGKVNIGDHLEGYLSGEKILDFHVR